MTDNNIRENEQFIEIPFCCTTTIPEDFIVDEEAPSISFKSCLHCKMVQGRTKVKCDDGTSCGEIDACIIKLVGCIQFIASAPVGIYEPESHICCKGSICVNRCIRCIAGFDPYMGPCFCPCPQDDDVVPIELDSDSLKVCIDNCELCPTKNEYTSCQNVIFSGKFLVSKDSCNNI